MHRELVEPTATKILLDLFGQFVHAAHCLVIVASARSRGQGKLLLAVLPTFGDRAVPSPCDWKSPADNYEARLRGLAGSRRRPAWQ